jgi:hypothetical protein
MQPLIKRADQIAAYFEATTTGRVQFQRGKPLLWQTKRLFR